MVNGDSGYVHRFEENQNNEIEKIYVKFDDSNAGMELQIKERGNAIAIERVQTEYQHKGRSINRYQFCLIQAWAITIHKSQGLSLDTAVVNIGKAIFEPSMTYVALSRIRTLEGVFIEEEPLNIILRRIKLRKEIRELTLRTFDRFQQTKHDLRNYKVSFSGS